MTLEQLAELGITPASVAEALRTPDLACWIGLEGTKPSGFAMARADFGDLFALFVLPEAEGRGLGSRLLAEAEKWLALRGIDKAWLITGGTAGLRAPQFYARHGWQPDGREADGQLRFTKRIG